jgi:hypothetical protein
VHVHCDGAEVNCKTSTHSFNGKPQAHAHAHLATVACGLPLNEISNKQSQSSTRSTQTGDSRRFRIFDGRQQIGRMEQQQLASFPKDCNRPLIERFQGDSAKHLIQSREQTLIICIVEENSRRVKMRDKLSKAIC